MDLVVRGLQAPPLRQVEVAEMEVLEPQRSGVALGQPLDRVPAALARGLHGRQHLTDRPVLFARLPVGLALGEAFDLAQHAGARALQLVPQGFDRCWNGHRHSSRPVVDFVWSIPEDVVMTDRRRALARAAWRTVTTRAIYANPWIRVREDVAELPDGRTTLYGVVECRPAVGVLPFLDARTVVLVGQYRYAARDFYWEMPTGAVRAGESEEAAVQRELAEEAGYEAGRLVKVCSFHSSKSVMDETVHIYLAEQLRAVVRDGDDTEFIEVRSFAFDEVLHMVETSEIRDAMTVVAVLHAARRR